MCLLYLRAYHFIIKEGRNFSMLQVGKKQVKIFSIIIALVFVGSVAAIGVSQMGAMTSTASAASTSIGVIDYREAMNQSPDLAAANEQMQAAVEQAKADFESKSADMDDNAKAEYYQQTQQRLQAKQQELIEPITKKIDDQVKAVAEAKGLSVVIDKNAVVYGGQDITQDVIRKLAK